MQNEKFQVALGEGVTKAEVIVREVSTVNELPVKAPVKINIKGVIGSVCEFLIHRKDQPEQINQKRCHIIVNRENISIALVFNENDEYLKGSVTGTLSMHPKFTEFGINTGRVWAPQELGMFIKMNRAFFQDKSENMKLVTALMNFTGKVNSIIEKAASETGNRTDNFSQVVESNLPGSFSLIIPIFKGMPAETLEVETFAQINGREVAFILLSPAANQTMEDIRDKAVDDQLKAIRAICSDIAIIEE